ncbi:hypothetical protein SAMN02745166_00453 [Prosthecobacter debontii]|uniref:Uncharacterized protein n=1 Tax=Prosthecobacter debontii TaxID=48467 RepID=A0A1T4WKX9_9BACT|nr:hypothetical protein [Prosthecobacter debontii]SKA78006.1 hypothetical protein SAMN02745166_00453 [Prosthecobacter debontii]
MRKPFQPHRNALVTLSLLSVALLFFTLPADTAHAQEDNLKPDSSFFTKEGPWGKLQCYYFYLEAPDSVVSRAPTPDTQTRWRIPESEFTEFERLISDTELSNDLVSPLFNPRGVIRRNGIVNLFPSSALLEAMNKIDRQRIYAKLASFPFNEFYEYPIFFLGGDVDSWAKNSGLREDLVAIIRHLSYERGDTLAFSDIPMLLGMAQSASEAQFIKKKLTRTRTLIARLQINPKTDIQKMLDYWSTGLNLRRKELEPLFQATAAQPGIDYLDLLHVLPALPRKLLYTFPADDFTTHIRFPDCHWTTLNFFNFTAQDYYLDSHLASSAVLENFQQIEGPYRFGDVLMFINAKGNAYHSCIYLADDLVYTKNGANPLIPWVILELEDLKRMYNMDLGQGTIQGFRHKSGRLESE